MGAKLGGKTGGKYELGQNSDINVTPFVDVMLVLLIIFMVAAPLATVAIKIDLPPAQAPKDQDKKPTFLSVRRGGDLYLIAPDKTTETPLAQLGTLLGVTLPGNPADQTVLIRADKDVRYKEFMAVVNQLQKDGYYKIGLISEDLNS
ncbi:MAG TPA: biopolymer transporter ExbD [Caulobacteraceae bacterium]|nr:biopolymer transporter ExbD [Caulobacteraceae bacterium]